MTNETSNGSLHTLINLAVLGSCSSRANTCLIPSSGQGDWENRIPENRTSPKLDAQRTGGSRSLSLIRNGRIFLLSIFSQSPVVFFFSIPIFTVETSNYGLRSYDDQASDLSAEVVCIA